MKKKDKNISDRVRLLRIEIILKTYMLALVLVGCLFLEFVGVLGVFHFPVAALGITLFLFVLLNTAYLYFLKKAFRLIRLYVLVGVTDILFFTVLIHFLGGYDTPVLALLYMLPVPFFSILISPVAGYLITVGSFISYALLCGLEYTGAIPFYGNAEISPERLGIILFFLFFCFISLAFYVGYFSEVLRRHQLALSDANREIERQNLTLEDRINQRTQELSHAQEKLQAYSLQLEQAYNEKSVQLEMVQKRLETSLGELKLKYDYENIIGKSTQMQEVFRLMDKVTDFNVAILVQGESGTGKELVAKAIHYNGPRRKKPFIIQNCSAITDTLLESELFGHVKGAFTGAYQDRKGLFEEADQGTLFLDEIGDMSHSMQAKLLRALQEGEIRPVGGKRVIRVDVRIVSATNRDLKDAVVRGGFREDLFYRLNGVTIQIPPLRERREDILLLAVYFLNNFSEETGIEVKVLSQESKKLLFTYLWPGNVRELENTIKNACVIAQKTEIQIEDFRYKPELFVESSIEQMKGKQPGAFEFSPLSSLSAKAGSYQQKETNEDGTRHAEKSEVNFKSLKDTEREAIESALEACNGKRKDAARLLNIPIRTLYEKIKRYGIT